MSTLRMTIFVVRTVNRDIDGVYSIASIHSTVPPPLSQQSAGTEVIERGNSSYSDEMRRINITLLRSNSKRSHAEPVAP